MPEKETPLDGEIALLRETLGRARKALDEGEEDRLKVWQMIARLCDTSARVLLARRKLAPEADAEDEEWAQIERDMADYEMRKMVEARRPIQ